MEVQGLKETQAKLKQLSAKVAKQHTRTALKAGAKPIATQAKGNIKTRSGTTERSVTIRSSTRKGLICAIITLSKKLFTQKKGYYGDAEEEGHFTGPRLSKELTKGAGAKEAYQKRSVAAGRKFIEGSHFLERAYKTQKDAAMAIINEKLVELIEKEGK